MQSEWEQNVFAGLEELDAAGHDRISRFGHLDHDPDEPDVIANTLPVFEELELDAHAPRLA